MMPQVAVLQPVAEPSLHRSMMRRKRVRDAWALTLLVLLVSVLGLLAWFGKSVLEFLNQAPHP